MQELLEGVLPCEGRSLALLSRVRDRSISRGDEPNRAMKDEFAKSMGYNS